MARRKLDKETKKAMLDARNKIETVAKKDGNEAETRKRIDYIFKTLLGYDTFEHITQEYAIHGAGGTVHCDFAVQLDREESAKPEIIVEIKRVNIDLVPKHIRQVASYAIDIGCDWMLLTNGREWKLYHISFGRPPQTKLVDSWNLINDDPVILSEKFNLICNKNIRKGGLVKLWEKSNVLSAQNLLKVILSEKSLGLIRHDLKKTTEVSVSPDEIVGAFRHLLNEASVAEMEKIKISLPEKKQQKRGKSPSKVKSGKVDKESGH